MLLHVVIVFTRPQQLPGLSFIGQLQLPGLFGLACGLLWLRHAGSTGSKIVHLINGFLVVEILRGLIGYFVDPQNVIVKNDAWHWHSIKALALICFGMSFPVVSICQNLRDLSKLTSLLSWVGAYLGVYGLTHSGFGPGGFLGDENDLCATLLFLMPFSILCLNALPKKSNRKKHIFALLLICGGIVSTVSRGGMLGWGAAVAYLIYNSRHRSKAIGAVVVLVMLALPLTPQLFLDELASIKTDVGDNSGTVKARIEKWKISWEIFKDPRFMPMGVGLNNAPHWMTQFAYKADVERPNIYAGRAVHSLYFQLLADLGIYGFILFCFIFLRTVWISHRTHKELKVFQRRARAPNSAEKLGSITTELRFAEQLNYACTASLIGWIVAGIGVSILYYPTPWLWVGITLASQQYAKAVLIRAKLALSKSESKEPSSKEPENS